MEYQQQDSQEFLRFLLDGMSEDLCRRRPNATTTKLASSASTTNTTLQILDCGSPERNELQTSPNIIRSSAVNLPNLPNSQQDNNQPQSSPNEHQIAKRNLSQRLRLETQTMRQSDSNEKISSQELLQLAAGDDEEIQLSSDEDHINPSSTTGKDAEPKLRVLKDIKEVRAATNDEIGSDDGNVTGTIPQVDTVDNAESPRDKNSSRASGSAPSSARNSVTQSLSNSLRGVKLRIKRSIGAHEGEEQTTSTTKHTSDDSVLMDHTKTPQRVGQGSQSKIEMLTSVPSNGKELEVVDTEAKEAWERYLKLNDSIITDIFGGLLQSTIQCLTCNHRSFAFDPFLDLSVPISKESEGAAGSKGLFGTLRQAVSVPASDNKSTLEKCLEKFTSEEILDGDNMVTCEQCNKKRKSVKRLSIFRYPKVLVSINSFPTINVISLLIDMFLSLLQ